MKMTNPTGSPVKFKIANGPGEAPDMFDVEPGGECDVPDGYVVSGLINRIAPGLVKASDAPKPVAQPEAKAPEAKAPKRTKGKK